MIITYVWSTDFPRGFYNKNLKVGKGQRKQWVSHHCTWRKQKLMAKLSAYVSKKTGRCIVNTDYGEVESPVFVSSLDLKYTDNHKISN